VIIVEGPDGGGKSSLVSKLMVEFGLPLHERASEGAAGVIVPDLYEWAHRDVVSMPHQPLQIYDRHPLISEYVYGPICRAALPPGFATPNAHVLVRMMAPLVLVVVCRPPNERLRASVSDQRDMPGVVEHVERIASAYDALRIFWPGRTIGYDYTTDQSDTEPPQLPKVLAACRIHVAQQLSKRRHPSTGRYA
jgi:hypothetical protein